MSVTMKLADEDAKLVGAFLATIGNAAIEARGLRTETPLTQPLRREADIRDAQTKHLGERLVNALTHHGHMTPEELVRLGHAFDTAAIANEKR